MPAGGDRRLASSNAKTVSGNVKAVFKARSDQITPGLNTMATKPEHNRGILRPSVGVLSP